MPPGFVSSCWSGLRVRKEHALNENTKDSVEDVVSAALEATVSLVPILGGPTAVVLNRVLGSAAQRRRDQIVADLRYEVAKLLENQSRLEQIHMVSSDHFAATVISVVAASEATADEEKRKLLRNALRNGLTEEWVAQSENLRNVLVRSEYEDVAILDALRNCGADRRDGWVSEAPFNLLKHSTNARLSILGQRRIGAALHRLVADALVDEDEKSELLDSSTEDDDGNLIIQDGEVTITRRYRPSAYGLRFLRFVS